VELVVTRDTAAMEKAIGSFVDAYNDVLDTIRKYETYDSESNRRGVLLGDGTSSTIKSRLFSTVQGRADGVESQFSFIFEVGVKIGSGAKLEFDAEKFREAFEQDPIGVENLFAANRLAPREPIEISPGITVQPTEDSFLQLGVAEKLEKMVEEITNSIDGLLTGRTRTLDSIIDSQRDRIESIDGQLEAKRLRYETQFASMERAIAQLQTQSSALSSLQSLG
jgi:flagellar hook-associated protein 2